MGRPRDPTNNQARINARITYKLFNGAKEHSETNKISMSEVVRRALYDYLKEVPSTTAGVSLNE